MKGDLLNNEGLPCWVCLFLFCRGGGGGGGQISYNVVVLFLFVTCVFVLLLVDLFVEDVQL